MTGGIFYFISLGIYPYKLYLSSTVTLIAPTLEGSTDGVGGRSANFGLSALFAKARPSSHRPSAAAQYDRNWEVLGASQ